MGFFMKTTAEYLDAAKEKLNVSSDYGLAKRLDISRQAISQYRKNDRAFDNFSCMQIAQATGIRLESIIADMEMMREKDEKRREAWESYMKRLGGLAASVFVCIFTATNFAAEKVIQLALLSP
jgi:transcriptional regulator with XRE-family HTH domain